MTQRNTAKSLGPVLLLALAGCQSAQTTAAHKIADALPRALGPARHYDVQVDGDVFALARGRARRILVTGQEVTVGPDTILDTLDLDAEGVSFSTRSRRISHVDQATVTGTVGQDNLTRYVRAHHVGVPGLAVTLRDTDALAQVPINLPGLHTEATVSGTLAPDAAAPDHLDFTADAASVGVVPIPARLVNAALRLVNPVFDLSHLQVPVSLTQTTIAHGQVVLQGTADLDDFHPS